MKVQYDRDANGNIIIHMRGDISYESTIPLRKELIDILKKNSNVEITLNMQNIDFVGSSGIGQFVETLKMLNQKKIRAKVKNVSSEFIKAFQLYDLDKQDLANIIEDFDRDEMEINPKPYRRFQVFPN